ncbi:hypothetical protein DL766_004158 [Monosporascus sp. MC13-8B]|uniref:Modin n=1 Tax=Monosporascus cannonballus TaxID=155416 RepID=A0ABY0H341_9PEZI|nr:hypothetical protein DL763_010222 [Monosporascus cannonballus]RYO83201.1 hypothetical protein DL762_006246 [Monosporascus cannonballus]RYP31971.1 hypothetical protein DL766_004158 [Monosporascus sp. MC13-8B]
MAGNDDDRELFVSIVALVISLIALFGTLLQVLQTYFASSAAGFARCGVKTMGEWGKFTRRKFKPSDLRFEVEFETPVIFLAPPNNVKGPVPNEPIWYMDGSEDSYKETRTLLPNVDKEQREKRSQKELIHTADNERASWVELLAVIQKMESDSEYWQRMFYYKDPGNRVPPKFGERTLAVAVQKKIKSWDTSKTPYKSPIPPKRSGGHAMSPPVTCVSVMQFLRWMLTEDAEVPSSMTKPYATTTMCHLIELAAVLGLHWKEFSRSHNKYRAEGNGYMLTGAPVSDLGLVFTFQKTGRTLFEENRVIPKDEIKQLCFGVVPTIFCTTQEDEERLKFPFDQPEDLTTLQLGSSREIADTLTVMGCNTNTVNCFLGDEKNKKATIHLFPVAFEVLGMLGRTLHASCSGFRMLPNPTIYHWDKNKFSMWKLLSAYEDKIEVAANIPENVQIMKIKKNLELIFKARGNRPESEFTVAILDALHHSLDSTDNFLTKMVQEYLVCGVLRVHFETVLHLMNDINGKRPFDGLNKDTPEHRQIQFIDIYFDEVRPEAVRNAPKRRFAAPTSAGANAVSLPPTAKDGANAVSPSPTAKDDDDTKALVTRHTGFEGDDKLNTIWCALVFRMLCWLLLHDFHKNDVQLSKSELLGSRLPVYIV